MRGSSKYFNGGRGSFRGNGNFRSSRSFGNRMDNGRRGGGQRFNNNNNNNSYGRYGQNYNKYDNRRVNNSPSRDHSTSTRRTYRDADRERSYDDKRMRDNDRRLNSSTTRRGNRTPPPPPPPPISGSSNYRGSTGAGGSGARGGSTSHVDKSPSTYPKGSRHGTHNNGPSAGSGRTQRQRFSMTTRELRSIRKKVVLSQQRDRLRVMRMARMSSHIRRRRVQRSRSTEEDSADAKDDDSERSEKSDHKSRRQRDNVDDNNDEDNNSNKDVKESKKKRKTAASPAKARKSHSSKQQLQESDTESESNPVAKKKLKRETVEGDDTKKETTDKDKDKDDDVKDNSSSSKKKKNDVDALKKNKDSVSADETTVEKVKKSKDSSTKSKESSAAAKENVAEAKTDEENDDDNENDNKKLRKQHTKSFKHKEEKILFKLTCVHCHMKTFSFKQYSDHMYMFKHKIALQQVNRRQRAYLVRLRARQRATQREIEENVKEDFEPQFCNLCRLHYRIQKAKHQLSEHHCAMKKFLLPYCSVCRLSFKSPMSYEVHRCSIEHLKAKAHRGASHSDSDEEKNTREIDLNNFLTVDSVGEIDGDSKMDDIGENGQRIENAIIELEDKESPETEFDEKKFVKRVDAFYCVLCDTYAAAKGDIAVFVSKHCDQRLHKKNVKYFKRQEQIKKALKEETKNKNENKEDNTTAEPVDAKNKEENEKSTKEEPQKKSQTKNQVDEDEYESEDKLWEDVDKDIGDILAVVEEDESVLNIDIESDILTNQEKKSKETSVNKKEANAEEVANGQTAEEANK